MSSDSNVPSSNAGKNGGGATGGGGGASSSSANSKQEFSVAEFANNAAAAQRKAKQMGAQMEETFFQGSGGDDMDLKEREIKVAWDSKVQEREGVTKDVFGRRAWDKEHYEQLALKKAEEGSDGSDGEGNAVPIPASQRLYLQRRNERLHTEANVGKTIMQTDATYDAEKGGYWCPLCKKLMKDNLSWLDHLNGKKHQRMMGMNMVVKPATLEEVMDRIDEMRRKKLRKRGKLHLLRVQNGGGAATAAIANGTGDPLASLDDLGPDVCAPVPEHLLGADAEHAAPATAEDILAKMKKYEDTAELKAEDRKERKRRKREKAAAEAEEQVQMEEEDEETKMMRAMGLPVGFGGMK
ncbi:unnamed protein product [Amoebophrya sp. A25]|nr:unnamed protein product [Amoebophrya sp. A25]|eukprot:GSA25T00019720001.1